MPSRSSLSAVCLNALVMLQVIAGGGSASAQQTSRPAMLTDIRNARYCEIIPLVRDGFHLTGSVYNTLGLNDCPEAQWSALDETTLKARFGAMAVLLNGPRHFLMDSIRGDGQTASGETIDIGGIAMTKRATLRLGLSDLLHKPYEEKSVERSTQYVFKSGQPVFVLTAPDGSRYAMQAYAQIVDRSLTYEALPSLENRLKLPRGWRFSVMTPAEDLVVGAAGLAVVVQDDLQNTYQRF